MSKSSSTKATEIHSDAWSRFERAVDVVAKSPPQHRANGKKTARKKASQRKARSKNV